MAYIKIRIRGDTAENWQSSNPILEEREMAVEIITQSSVPWKLKIGDGHTPWNDLPYSFDYQAVQELYQNTSNLYNLFSGKYNIFSDALDDITEARTIAVNASDHVDYVKDQIDEIVNSALIQSTQQVLTEIIAYLAEINAAKDSYALHIDAGDAKSFDVQNIMGGTAVTVDQYEYDAGNALSIIN